ncbi:MAG: calcineurin-like phosphoesterase family protein [Muribaculaceae bacterium]
MRNLIFCAKNLIVLIFLVISLGVSAQTYLTGTVSSKGSGIAGVVVTDGYSCVKTNSFGSYSILKSPEAKFIYISTPAGYLTDINSTIPQFYKNIDAATTIYNFELTKNAKSDLKHTVVVQADVQVTSVSDLNQYSTVVADCKEYMKQYSGNDVFGLDCGDIVGDSPQLFPEYLKRVLPLNIPIYRAIGNHDMDYYGRSNETSTHTFESYFGPTYYSFNKGNAHYIVVDNNFFIGREYFYMGYIDETTFHWLEQDLENVKDGSLLFFVMHIPSQLTAKQQPFEYNYGAIADQTVNAGAIHDLLKKYDTHMITGHMHYNINMCFSDRLMEHNTASICGTWWQLDVCLDGAPRGYAVYEVDGSNVQYHYKGQGHGRDYQMRVYDINASSEFPNDIIANVWNYDDKWKVEWFEDGKLKGEMTKFIGFDPFAAALCADPAKVKYSWIAPVKNEHMFRATPLNKNAKIEVRVTDRFGNIYKQEIKK